MKLRCTIIGATLVMFCFAAPCIDALAQTGVKSAPRTGFFGSISKGIYTNEFFRFELITPAEWLHLNSTDVDSAKKIGIEGLKSNDLRYNRQVDKAAEAEAVILTLARKPFGAVENSAFSLGVLKQPNRHITAKMVAEGVKSLLLKNPSNKLIADVKTEMIGGRAFSRFDLEIGMYGAKVPIRYYATIISGYSMSVSMSYSDVESLDAMEAALRSIKFRK